MRRTLLISLAIVSTLSLGMLAWPVHASGMFDWMSPNKWLNNNNRDYDRDYYPRGYSYGYPGYAYPGWGGYGYPGTFGYPALSYPSYGYPVQNQQAAPAPAPAPPPIPQ